MSTKRLAVSAPTPRAEWVKPNDLCKVGAFGTMIGVVISIRYDTAIPQAKVKWASGSTGIHTITTLRNAVPK